MLQIDVKLNPVADEGSMDRVINRMMGTHNSKPMVGEHTSPSDNAEQEFQQKIENSSETMDNFDDVMSKLKDSFKDVLGSIKALAGDLDNLDQKLPAALQKARKDDPKGTTKDLAEYRKDVNGVVGIGNNATGIVQSLSYGNVAGGVISGVNMMSNQAFNMGNAAGNAGMNGLAKGLMGAGGVIALTALGIKAADSMADTYEDALPGMDSLNRAFGGDKIGFNSAERNSDKALKMRGNSLTYSQGTGLKTDEFIQLSTSLANYGITDENRAYSIARASGNMSRFTGAEASQIANFAGLMERYGGNGEKSIEQAYKAARTSGLDKSQFGEFLTGLQSVVENGISKGFIKSADDVSESLANISLLSGNSELWSGKNGIQRYQQMGDSMGSATSLSSTSSMLLYQAMANKEGNAGKGWIDIMSDIEKGDWGDSKFLESYKKTLNGAYSNDRDQQIATIKENFGLNWTGAKDFYENVLSKVGTEGFSEEDVKKKIEEYKTKTEFQSDSTKMTDALKSLDQSIAMLGQDPFRAKAGLMDGIASDTRAIAEFLTGKKGAEQVYKTDAERVAAEPIIAGSGSFGDWTELNKELEPGMTSSKETSIGRKKTGYDNKMSMVNMLKIMNSDLIPEDRRKEAFELASRGFVEGQGKGMGEFSASYIPEFEKFLTTILGDRFNKIAEALDKNTAVIEKNTNEGFTVHYY